MPESPRPDTDARRWIKALDPADLDDALERALAHDGASLVDIRTDAHLV